MNVSDNLGGIILLGGYSKRMGTDKYRLPFFGELLIERLIRLLQPAVKEILLVTRDPKPVGFSDCKTVTDILPVPSALSGIHAGLRASPYPYNFVLACDLPLFDSRLVGILAKGGADHDVVVPRTDNGLETLSAIYSKACIPVIESLVAQNNYQITALYPKVKTVIVEQYRFDEEIYPGLFFNMNTKEDYSEALKILEQRNKTVDL